MDMVKFHYAMKMLGLLMVLAAALLLGACGGGGESSPGGGGGGGTPPPGNRDRPPALTPKGVAVMKFRSADREWVALTERLRRIEDTTAPDRSLLLAADDTQSPISIDPPSGWSLIDFALHPSGEISLVLATDSELRLQRRSRTGQLLDDVMFSDDQVATDPFIGDVGMVRDPQSLVPFGTRDAVRLEPLGEDVIIAFRSGRNAVITQLLTHATSGGFQSRWRTLVEPGVPIDAVRLTSGTFDPFKSLDNQWHVSLAADAQGRSAIAVSLGHTELPAGHSQYFGEPLDPNLVSGAIVTLLDASGHRSSATAMDTHVLSDVQVVSWAGNTVLIGGRLLTATRSDGGGWDGYLARFTTADRAPQLQVLDFDRGDVVLDVTALADGRIVIAGSTAYVQNPTGASISEDAEPLLAVLPGPGMPAQRIVLNSGPRHNQVRTVSVWRDRQIIGGLQNGPGTHSADADPALLTCDGFLRAQDF